MGNKKLWYLLSGILFISFSCGEDNDDDPVIESNGIFLSLTSDPALNGDPSFQAEIDLTDVTVTIFDATTSQPVGSPIASENLPDSIDLDPGSYYIEASNGEDQLVGFEVPLITTVTDVFAIQQGNYSLVQLSMRQTNVRTSVNFVASEDGLLDEEDFTVSISSSQGSLVFTEEENQAGYFPAGEELIISLGPDNYVATQTVTNTSPGDNYQVFVELQRGSEPTSIQVDNINQRISFMVQIPEPVAPVSPFNIWSGPDLTFTKLDDADPSLEENQDRLTDKVWLTRGNDGGQIYNIVTETIYNQENSPVGTEWAQGTTLDIENLQFSSFRSTIRPRQIVGRDLVLHLIEDDIYIDIRFTSWSTNRGGGFEYVRSSQ